MESLVEALLDQEGLLKIVSGTMVDCTEETITIVTRSINLKTEILILSLDEILELRIISL
ncbi:MAG: hypothetical protein ACMXX8_00665 [Candidatus Woesearchaeota archaeon]